MGLAIAEAFAAEEMNVAMFARRRKVVEAEAERLGALAREVRVTAVVLQVGGNDDPALVPTGIACIRAFLDPAAPDCRETVGPQWSSRLAAMAPKVEAAVADVRAAIGKHAGDDVTVHLQQRLPAR